MIRGLDASAVQAALPFDRLSPDLRFVILKAQQGNDGFDPWFERNAKAALERGLHVFPYCFTYPLPHLDPVKQAKLFVDRLAKTVGAGRRIFLDNEWPPVVPSKPGEKGWKEWGCSPAQLADWQRDNAYAVRELAGMAPAIYTYDWWFAAVRDGVKAYGFPTGGDVSWASEFDLWMAWYVKGWPKDGDSPKIPRPWQTWRFWQFDGNGGLRLPNGLDADFCVFNGDEAALEAWAGGSACVAAKTLDLNTVAGLQARLVELGLDPGPVDGHTGPRTLAAIRVFQASRGLVQDGVVGPKTRAALAEER